MEKSFVEQHKKNISFFLVCFMLIFLSVCKINANIVNRIYENKITLYGKIIQITDYPITILGIQTVNQIILEINKEKTSELLPLKDSYLKIEGYLLSSSIYSKYSFEPVSWNPISVQEIENFESNTNKQFKDIRWKATSSKKWTRILKNLEITLNNTQENINIIFVEMDIFNGLTGERKRWFFGVPPQILPSKEIKKEEDFIIKWSCDKLNHEENEELKYELKLGYIINNNFTIYKFSSKNKWGSIWKS